jgi:hypothetical protein
MHDASDIGDDGITVEPARQALENQIRLRIDLLEFLLPKVAECFRGTRMDCPAERAPVSDTRTKVCLAWWVFPRTSRRGAARKEPGSYPPAWCETAVGTVGRDVFVCWQ